MTDSNVRYGIAQYAKVLRYDDGRKDRIEPFYIIVKESGDQLELEYLEKTRNDLYCFSSRDVGAIQFDTKEEALMEYKAFAHNNNPKIEWQDDEK